VQGGQAQIGEILLSGYENEDPIFGIDTIPFLATSYAASLKLWKASQGATEARFAKQGLRILYAVAWPPQGLYSAKPVNSAADLKGSKWRAYNPGSLEIWCYLMGIALSASLAWFSVRLTWQSYAFNDISQGNDATPLWIPQIGMALGTVVLCIAFIDEFVAFLRRSGLPHKTTEQALHVE
jgi:hypothetical protein